MYFLELFCFFYETLSHSCSSKLTESERENDEEQKVLGQTQIRNTAAQGGRLNS